MSGDPPAFSDSRLGSLPHDLVVHDRVSSLEEAAAARGLEPSQIIKTIVVRRGDDDYVFVLVPGDRVIDWPSLRNHLGVNRLSMPDADEALAATGYVRGTITPFGASKAWPVIADNGIADVCSIGAGAPGASLTVERNDLVAVLGADLADVTKPPSGSARRSDLGSGRR